MDTVPRHRSTEFWCQTIAPLAFLGVMLAAWWGYFHLSTGTSNTVGPSNETLFVIDAMITMPLVCFFLIKDKKKALLKGVVLASVTLFIGSFLIPTSEQYWLPSLLDARYLVIALFVIFEIVTAMSIWLLIKREFNTGTDPDLAMLNGIARYMPPGTLRQLWWFEVRMWAYFLFPSRMAKLRSEGDQHFDYWKKDDNHTNALGFIMIIAFEVPIVHLLLHFLWSDVAANIVTALSLLGLVFFIAERNAMKLRPISLKYGHQSHDNELIIRYGLSNPLIVPLSHITQISSHQGVVKRASHRRRFNFSGAPNIKLILQPNEHGAVTEIYLGVDDPDDLLRTIAQSMSQREYG